MVLAWRGQITRKRRGRVPGVFVSGTGEARKLKFGVWIEYGTYWPANEKLSSKGAWLLEHVTVFDILGPLPLGYG